APLSLRDGVCPNILGQLAPAQRLLPLSNTVQGARVVPQVKCDLTGGHAAPAQQLQPLGHRPRRHVGAAPHLLPLLQVGQVLQVCLQARVAPAVVISVRVRGAMGAPGLAGAVVLLGAGTGVGHQCSRPAQSRWRMHTGHRLLSKMMGRASSTMPAAMPSRKIPAPVIVFSSSRYRIPCIAFTCEIMVWRRPLVTSPPFSGNTRRSNVVRSRASSSGVAPCRYSCRVS